MVFSFCLISLCSKLLEGWLTSTRWKPEASFGCGHACEMAQGLVTSRDTQVMGENSTFSNSFPGENDDETEHHSQYIQNLQHVNSSLARNKLPKMLPRDVHQCRFCGMGVDSGPNPHP